VTSGSGLGNINLEHQLARVSRATVAEATADDRETTSIFILSEIIGTRRRVNIEN